MQPWQPGAAKLGVGSEGEQGNKRGWDVPSAALDWIPLFNSGLRLAGIKQWLCINSGCALLKGSHYWFPQALSTLV